MTNRHKILNLIKTHRPKLRQFGIRDIGLFGSYVRDEQSPGSDIDILIDFEPESENFDNFMAACDYIENLFKNEKVDIVTRNGLSPFIGPDILKEVYYV